MADRKKYGKYDCKRFTRPEPVRKYRRKRRTCLLCGDVFSSSWIGNRRCARCNHNLGYAGGPGLDEAHAGCLPVWC